ncbi:MAG: acyl-CoA dehydrogenase [Calditrichaeota bacterium]|nr:acyl-CoA dehydrogenase [Calditrichota bacterium]
MDFQFSEEQLAIRDMVRDFARKEIAPHIMTYDEKKEFPFEIIKKLGELGLLGITYPEAFGGAAMGYIEYALIVEELSAVDPSVGLIVAAHNSLGTLHIFTFGSEEQKKRYIPRLMSGETLSAWALTEPGSGSDAKALKTIATRDGDDWVLNGSKTFITNANYSDYHVIIALTDPEKGTRGISAFVVEKGTPGFTISKNLNKLGMRASDTAELFFNNCRVPHENMLGEEGSGFHQAMSILDGGRISIGAMCVGIARGAYESALKYANEREAFGKKVSDFQATKFKLADMAMKIDASRLLIMRSAWMKDNDLPMNLESAMAKLYASEVAVEVANEAVQIFGGYGFIKEYPAEKFYRDAKLGTIGEGTSEILRLVIARELLHQTHTV